MISRAFSYALTHDEVTFYHKALQHYYTSDFLQLFSQKNEYGYGGIWFTIYSFMIYISESITNIDYSSLIKVNSTIMGGQVPNIYSLLPIILMKLINIFSINLMFAVFLKEGKKNIIAYYGILFLLITPMLYWSGKLASPDILAASIVSFGFYLYIFLKKENFAIIIFAIALSIKISVVPIVMTVFIYEIVIRYNVNKKLWLKPILIHVSILIGIFLFLNLYLFINANDYIKTLLFYANNHSNNIQSLTQLLSSSDIRLFRLGGSAWDLIFVGSLFYWATQPIVLLVFFLMSLKQTRNSFIHFLFLILFLISFLFILRQSSYGWNWFPFIMIFPLIFLNLKNTLYTNFLSILFILISLFYSYNNINMEINNKDKQIENIGEYRNNKISIDKCIDSFLNKNKLKPIRTVNYSEIQVGINESTFLHSYWGLKNKYQLNDFILIGNRTQNNLPQLKNKIKEYNYKSGTCSFINLYFIIGEKK